MKGKLAAVTVLVMVAMSAPLLANPPNLTVISEAKVSESIKKSLIGREVGLVLGLIWGDFYFQQVDVDIEKGSMKLDLIFSGSVSPFIEELKGDYPDNAKHQLNFTLIGKPILGENKTVTLIDHRVSNVSVSDESGRLFKLKRLERSLLYRLNNNSETRFAIPLASVVGEDQADLAYKSVRAEKDKVVFEIQPSFYPGQTAGSLKEKL